MTGESRHRKLESLFLACVELAPAERGAFLDLQCAGDAALREQVEDLLRRDAEIASPSPVIGPYTLGARIGEGGFGEVYEATQTSPMRRQVAIKILKHGMDSRAVLARFEAERHALARMDHPGIAKVYDAGVTEAGRSYFVMERVFGESITRACDEGHLTLRARLALFVEVCRAVQHAHTKGIIHRDLKPSNILVTNVDGTLHPKVIDFGIAKATALAETSDPQSSEAAPRTLQGEILGTPEYMSPEQAASRGIDVDTRSDVYSLGVVLFQLLTGRLPFPTEQLRRGGFTEMQRILLEEEPPKPSAVTTSAAPRELRGDLDWIVVRALEKDRGQRYVSAAALADDVGRHLRDEPVLTGPPTTMYRLRKLVRRHRMLVGSAVAVLLALVVGIVATATQAVRASRAEDQARAEAEIANAVNEFLGRMLAAGDPTEGGGGRELTVVEIVRTAAAQLDARAPSTAAVEAGVRHALGVTFRGLGRYDAADAQFARADSIRSAAGTGSREWLETRLERADVAALRGREGVADSMLIALESPVARYGRADLTLRARYLLARGGVLANLGRIPESDSLFTEALAIRRSAASEAAGDAAATDALGDALRQLSTIRRKQNRLDESETLARDALDIAIRAGASPARFDVASAQARLSSVLQDKGAYAEADSLLSEAIRVGDMVLGAEHPHVAQWLVIRGQVRTRLGALDVAEADVRRAIRIFSDAGLARTARGATLLSELATILQIRGALDEALELRLQAIDIQKSASPDSREDLAVLWNNIGSTYRLMARYADAELAFLAALEGFRAAPGANPTNIYIALHNLGKTRLDRGHAVEAEETLREAAAMGSTVLPDGHPNRAILATTYGRTLAALGRTEEARRWLTEARDDLTAALGPDHPRTKEAAQALAGLD